MMSLIVFVRTTLKRDVFGVNADMLVASDPVPIRDAFWNNGRLWI